MIDKTEIIKKLMRLRTQYDVNVENMTIIMGSALVMQNVKRETNDIDLSCNSQDFKSLIAKGYTVKQSKSGLRKIEIEECSIYENWEVRQAIEIDGYIVASLLSVANDKCRLGRCKDFSDLAVFPVTQKSNIEFFELYSFPNYLRGLLHNGDNERIAIIIQGYFSSNKIGVNRLYFNIARALSEENISVLRVDLSCMGESDGDFEELEFNMHIKDLFNIITELRKRGYKKIDIIAHCEGCFEAIRMLKYFDCINTVIMISPVLCEEKAMTSFFGKDGYAELMNTGKTYRKGLLCKKEFFSLDYLLFEEKYLEKLSNKSCLVIMADKDEFADNDKIILWSKNNSIEYVMVNNANHNFITTENQEQLIFYILKGLNQSEEN